MKKIIYLFMTILTIFTFSLGSISAVYASESDEVYTYQDESSTSVFTLIDETIYECMTSNAETGETVNLTGTYIKEGARISFYFSGGVLLEAEIGEENVLSRVVSETEEEIIPPDTEELDILKEIEELSARITEWVIAAILGVSGTTLVAFIYRKSLKALVEKVLSAIGLVKKNKEEAEESIKGIKDEATNTLASLKTVKKEIVEETQKENEITRRQNLILCKAMLYIAGGMKELVVNGTSEKVCNLLEELDKGVNENAGQEVQ